MNKFTVHSSPSYIYYTNSYNIMNGFISMFDFHSNHSIVCITPTYNQELIFGVMMDR